MRQCPTCGSSVSEQATVCPDCGMDLKSVPADAASSPTVIGGGSSASVPSEVQHQGSEVQADGHTPPLSPEGHAPAPVEPTMSVTPSTATAPEPPSEHPIPPTNVEPTSVQEAPAPPVPLPGPATAGGGTARLLLKRAGAPTGEEFPLATDGVVGRFDPESGPVDVDLGQIPEAVYVSRHHARIYRGPDGTWLVQDLGSRNGTFVRARAGGPFQRISGDHPLHEGDEIALGNARFGFTAGA